MHKKGIKPPGMIGGLVARLQDRNKLPGNLWYPEIQELEFEFEHVKFRQHAEFSKTVRNSMLCVLGFSLYCLLTLAAPDALLVSDEGTVKLPIANVTVGLSSFLIVAPMVLIGLTVYLHYFLGCLLRIRGVPTAQKLPTIFNLDSRLPKIVSTLVFYFLTPFVLAYIMWKALPFKNPDQFVLMGLTFGTGVALAELYRRRLTGDGAKWKRGVVSLILGLTVGFGISQLMCTFNWFPGEIWIERGIELPGFKLTESHTRLLDLRGANLEGADMEKLHSVGVDYRRANLQRANLKGADLERAKLRLANLKGADLRGAGLEDANLKCADLQGADLQGAGLEGATLTWADLRGAKLVGANLHGTNLEGACLIGADLRGLSFEGAKFQQVNLARADLREANLKGANLEWTYLRGANLEGANLEGANLKWANLQGTNLEEANLQGADLEAANLKKADLQNTRGITQEQLDAACGDEQTQLPDGLTIKPCEKKKTDTRKERETKKREP